MAGGIKTGEGPSGSPAFATMRGHMVESQVRPNQVNDRRVIEAMRRLRREDFAPAGSLVYADADVALGGGRYLLAPMLIGRLAQLVMMDNPARVLVVAAGAGYGAAVLAGCDAAVTALEEQGWSDEALYAHAPAVRRVHGPLAGGWPDGAPYQVIFIEGAVPAIPRNFAAQLAPGGRVVTILAEAGEAGAAGGGGGLGRAVLAEPAPGGFAMARMFDCTARILPAFAPAPVFSF